MPDTVERNTRTLKAVVIVMGVLIVAGMAVVIATIVKRVNHGGVSSPAASVDVAAAAPGGFGTVDVPLPARCRVATATPSGERLVLQLAGNSDECRQIMVVDLASGRLLGRLNLVSPAGVGDSAGQQPVNANGQ